MSDSNPQSPCQAPSDPEGRKQAIDITTHPDHLYDLMEQFPREVAANANADIETLATIANAHPSLIPIVEKNPSFNLALSVASRELNEIDAILFSLENPEWTPETLERLGKYFLASDDPSYIIKLLLSNPTTPPTLLEHMREALENIPEEHRDAPMDVDHHVNADNTAPADGAQELQDALQAHLPDLDLEWLADLSRRWSFTPDFQEAMLEHAPEALATCAGLTESTWRALANHSQAVRVRLLGNPLTPDWVLAESFLAEQRELEKPLHAAENEDEADTARVRILENLFDLTGVLLEDGEDYLAKEVFTWFDHPQTGEVLLNTMAQSPYVTFYEGDIAAHPRSTEKTFRYLDLGIESVQWHLALNPNTPTDIVAELASQEDPTIRGLALNHPNYAEESPRPRGFELMTSDFDKSLVTAHTADPDLAGESPHALVRLATAKNPNTNLETLRNLTRDGDRRVRALAETHLTKRDTPD